MKHDILEEVWRIRQEISAQSEHDLSKLAAMLRRKEAPCGKRLARLPVVRRTMPESSPALREEPPPYGRRVGKK